MSSLLDQAIVDAKLLRDSSMKRAKEIVVEQYAEEIKKYTNLMLEQDEAGGGSDPLSDPSTAPDLSSAPLADTPAEPPPGAKKVMDNVPPSYLGEDNLQEIELNLDSIVEKIDALQKDLNIKTTPNFDEPAHAAVEQGNQSQLPPDGLAENVQGQEELENMTEEETVEEDLDEEYQLEEEMIVDMANVDPGGIANEIELKKQVAVSQALEAQNSELQEQLDAKVEELDLMEAKLQSMLAKLQETKEKLKKSVQLNVELKEGVQMLTRKVGDVNLLNARLLYTNKTLGNSSLNERQKKQIAESVSRAKSGDEAKTIYETLQRSVSDVAEKRTAPQSLTEALSKSPAPFLPRKEKTTVDPVAARWQLIAGIKK